MAMKYNKVDVWHCPNDADTLYAANDIELGNDVESIYLLGWLVFNCDEELTAQTNVDWMGWEPDDKTVGFVLNADTWSRFVDLFPQYKVEVFNA